VDYLHRRREAGLLCVALAAGALAMVPARGNAQAQRQSFPPPRPQQGRPTAENQAAVRVIEFEHDGRNTSGYAMYATYDGGKEQRINLGFVAPNARGMVRIQLPRIPGGTTQLAVTAYNQWGESPRVPIPFGGTAAPLPSVQGTAAPRPNSGFLSRLWRLVVGSDNP